MASAPDPTSFSTCPTACTVRPEGTTTCAFWPSNPWGPRPGRVFRIAAAGALLGPVPFGHGEAKPQRGEVVSGVPGVKETDSGAVKRWRRQELTVHIDSSLGRLGDEAAQAVEAGFAAWQAPGVPLPAVSIEQSTGAHPRLETNGRNEVMVGRIDIAGHENDLAVTIAFSDADSGEIVEADILINERHAFGIVDEDSREARSHPGPPARASRDNEPREREDEAGTRDCDEERAVPPTESPRQEAASCSGQPRPECGERYDLQSIVTHEVGHFFGLGEDYEDAFSTMFHCTSTCETHKRTPLEEDVSVLAEIYEEAGDEDVGIECSAASPSRQRSGRGACGILLGLAGCWGLRRRIWRSKA